MAFTNYDRKEINCKVVYCGPEGAGKLTNLRSLYQSTSFESQAELMSFDENFKKLGFFGFLPISLGRVNDFHIRLHLYTLPDRILYPSLVPTILKGVDGLIFVADSKVDMLHDNIKSMESVKGMLASEGLNFTDVPSVIQYNKRDVPQTVDVKILRRELNPFASPDQEAVATQAKGTMETVRTMAKQILKQLAV
jgi:hypothetical protein